METLFIASFWPSVLLTQFHLIDIKELGQIKFKKVNWYTYLELAE